MAVWTIGILSNTVIPRASSRLTTAWMIGDRSIVTLPLTTVTVLPSPVRAFCTWLCAARLASVQIFLNSGEARAVSAVLVTRVWMPPVSGAARNCMRFGSESRATAVTLSPVMSLSVT